MKPKLPERGSDQLAQELGVMFIVLAALSLLLIAPFAFYNLYQGKLLLSLSSLTAVAIFCFNAWSIYRHNRNYADLVMYVLVPVVIFVLTLSVYHQGVIGAFWCYPAVISSFIILPERRAWMANLALFITVFPTIWIFIDHHLAIRIIVTLLIVSAYAAVFVNVIYRQQKKLHSLATTDALTGIFNRTLLQDTLEQAIHQNSRSGVPMTVITIDLDNFKQINDELGHEAGDRVLQEVAGVLQERSRKVDRVFRIGGEEFLIFLFNADVEAGTQVAKEIRERIETKEILSGQTITASAGVATLQPQENWREWVNRSDSNLYAAKVGGRNRVIA